MAVCGRHYCTLTEAHTATMGGTHDDDPKKKAAVESKLDRRQQHRAREAAAGWTRCIVRCHVDDVAKIKAYASALIEERTRPKARSDKAR